MAQDSNRKILVAVTGISLAILTATVLVYKYDGESIVFERMGTHSDLFRK
jgi:hypothetical protein